MSVIEKIQTLFKRKNKPFEDSMVMSSLGMPVNPLATGTMQANAANVPLAEADEKNPDFAVSRIANAQTNVPSEQAENLDLLKLPVLGNRTVAQHQGTLLMLLVL